MKTVNLTQGYVARVDDEDYLRVSQYKWHVQITEWGQMYAVRNVMLTKRKWITYRMHRVILGIIDPAIKVDHEDHDGLNNQRYNLRAANDSQNNHNQKLHVNNTSGFKGVNWHKATEMWRARIMYLGKAIELGRFVDKLEAALVYDRAATEYFGAFACTNKTLGLL